MIEPCLAPKMEHTMEWYTAEFGSQQYRCILCGHIQDVPEDSFP